MRPAMALGALLALAGCALPKMETPFTRPASEREAPAGRTAADEMMAYVGRLTGLRESALPAEAARQRELMQRDTSDLTRVKAALALSLASPGEDAELHALVDPVVRAHGGDADVRSMASFLQALAAERRRAKESAAASTARLREERRASEAQKQRADALQERAAQLQQKLDALTEIEKSLSDRQGTPR
jgi:hypothetical protein